MIREEFCETFIKNTGEGIWGGQLLSIFSGGLRWVTFCGFLRVSMGSAVLSRVSAFKLCWEGVCRPWPYNAYNWSNFRILSRSTNYCLFLNIKGTSRSENMSQTEVCRKTRDYFSFKLSFNKCIGVGWVGAGESGGVSKSEDSFVYELSAKLLMKSLPFLFLI